MLGTRVDMSLGGCGSSQEGSKQEGRRDADTGRNLEGKGGKMNKGQV